MGRGSRKRSTGIAIDRLPKPPRLEANSSELQNASTSTPPTFSIQRHVSYELSGARLGDRSFVTIPILTTQTSVQPDNVLAIPPLITSSSASDESVIPDEADIERCDDNDRELELEGLGHLSLTSVPTEEISHIDGSRKRRRTQAVSRPPLTNLIILI